MVQVAFPEQLFCIAALAGGVRPRDAVAAAIHWYQRGEISQEKAAQIAGLDRNEFLLALARERADVFAVDLADLKRELERA